jgi:hypothetical protein
MRVRNQIEQGEDTQLESPLSEDGLVGTQQCEVLQPNNTLE